MEFSAPSNVDLTFERASGTKGKFLVLDTETTGLLPTDADPASGTDKYPRVVQVAWLMFDEAGRLIESQDRFILQSHPVPAQSTKVHRIDDRTLVQRGEKARSVWPDFLQALSNCDYVVGHHLDFDIPVIESELARLNIHNAFAGKRKLCTMKLGKEVARINADDGIGYRYPSLEELYKISFYGRITETEITGLHNAYTDAAITARVFFKLIGDGRISADDASEEPFKLPDPASGEPALRSLFFLKIILPTLVTILLFILIIFAVIIPRFKESIMVGKREMIRELTNSAASILEKYEKDEQAGLLTGEEARKTAISRIQYLRYGTENKDYFWITDMKPDMVMHPYRTDLNGTSLLNFTDPHGKRLFVEMVEICKREGHGYVAYMWQWKDDTGHIVPKLSYVKAFRPWGWIIGTGIYIEDVEKEIRSLTNRLLLFSVIITLVISLLLTYISLQSLKIEKKRKKAEAGLMESREKYKTLVDATTDGLIMTLDEKTVFSNHKIHEMTGFGESELANQPFSRLVSKNNDAETMAIFRNGNIPDGQYEVRLAVKDRDFIDTIVTVSSILFSEKHGKLITVRDTSIHQKPDGKTDELLSILELAGTGFIRVLLNHKGLIAFASKATGRMLGFSDARELSRYSILDFFADPHEKKRYRQQLLEEGSIKNAIIHMKRRDGRICVVTVNMILVQNESQQMICDGIIEDITERMSESQDKDDFIGWLQAQSHLLHNQVDNLVRPAEEVQMDAPVRRAVEIMAGSGSDVLFVCDREKAKVGILTAGDISRRVLFQGVDLQRPVYEFMSAPVVSVSLGETLSVAIRRMRETPVSHLAVRHPDGSLSGILHEHAIADALFNSFSFLENIIETARSVGELVSMQRQFQRYLSHHVKHSANPVITGRNMAMISGCITRKLISMAMEEAGEPPVEFVFVALGSEGRMEQTLATDQDNAILYRDVPPEEAEHVQTWFNNLGETVCNHLNTIGFRFCKGRVMAKNPLWCKPLETWKSYFSQWISNPEPRSLLDVSIFFDLRAIYGSSALVSELRAHIDQVSEGQSGFFYNLAENVLSFKAPMSITGGIHTEKRDNREGFDTKNALIPYIMFARIYSIYHHVESTGTLDRMRALKEMQVIPLSTFREFSYGFEFLMQLRYRHQVYQYERSEEITNLVNLHDLPEAEETALRKVLSQVADFQSRLNLDFKRTIL